jgi:hypothetical protein
MIHGAAGLTAAENPQQQVYEILSRTCSVLVQMGGISGHSQGMDPIDIVWQPMPSNVLNPSNALQHNKRFDHRLPAPVLLQTPTTQAKGPKVYLISDEDSEDLALAIAAAPSQVIQPVQTSLTDEQELGTVLKVDEEDDEEEEEEEGKEEEEEEEEKREDREEDGEEDPSIPPLQVDDTTVTIQAPIPLSPKQTVMTQVHPIPIQARTARATIEADYTGPVDGPGLQVYLKKMYG